MTILRQGLHRPSGSLPGGLEIEKYMRVRETNVQSYGYLGEDLVNASFLLFGETVPVIEHQGPFYKILVFGMYEEYVDERLLADDLIEPTHFISAPFARVVTGSDVKKLHEKRIGDGYLRFTSPVRITDEADRGTGKHVYVEGVGWIPANAVRRIDEPFEDFVEVLLMLEGKSVYGHGERGGMSGDCSSIIQSALLSCGIWSPRIAGDMAKMLGDPVPLGALDGGLRRGDLVCWPGHVGTMLDDRTILHSSEWTMGIAQEPLRDLMLRRKETEPEGKRQVSAIRRLPGYLSL